MQEIDIQKKNKKDIQPACTLCTYNRLLRIRTAAGDKSRVCDAPRPQLAHCNEGTLIRRSSLESFRLCDAFVTERLVSIILPDAPNTRALATSLCFETLPESSSCFPVTIWESRMRFRYGMNRGEAASSMLQKWETLPKQ